MSLQAIRFYHLLLRLYPAQHQREYADHMPQAFNDLYRQKRQKQPNLWGWIGFWIHILSDTIISVTIEHYYNAKEHIVNKSYFSQPVALQFLPIAAILGLMLIINRNLDLVAIYASLFIGSCIGWTLSKMGIIPHNALWINYAKGIFIGFLGITIVMLGGISSPAIIERNLTPWVVLAIAASIYAVSLLLIHRLIYRLDQTMWAISIFLPVLALISVELSLPDPNAGELNQTYRLLALAFSLIQLLAVVLVTTVTLRQPKKAQTPIPMIVAGGMIYAIFNPGYFTGEINVWINLTIASFSLIITPLWWLYAKTENTRVWGTFALWVAMFVITTTLSIAGRWSLGLYPIFTTVFIIVVPLIVMMWVVLQRTSSSTTGSEPEIYSTSRPAKVRAAKR